jgi:hypothetical protein
LNAGVRLKLFAISLALVWGGVGQRPVPRAPLRSWLIDRIECELLARRDWRAI